MQLTLFVQVDTTSLLYGQCTVQADTTSLGKNNLQNRSRAKGGCAPLDSVTRLGHRAQSVPQLPSILYRAELMQLRAWSCAVARLLVCVTPGFQGGYHFPF